MGMFGFGAAELVVMVALLSGGGMGVPLGMPPLPEDPLFSRIAPEKCLWYLSWSGAAEPDAKSTNTTEQLLAEPEVRALFTHIEKALTGALAKGAGESPENKLIAA